MKKEECFIGQHVWSKEEWSGCINESIITEIHDTYVLFKGVTLPGSAYVTLESIYPTRDAAVNAENDRSTTQVTKYKAEIMGDTAAETTENLIRFMYCHTCAPCEEYTDAEARTAAYEIAKETLGINM